MVWAIVVTKPQQELRTNEAINRLSLDSRLFKLRKETVSKGRLICKTFPAFPRYVFVRPENRWHHILDIPTVIDFVRTLDENEIMVPAAINEDLIKALDNRSDGEYFIDGAPKVIKRFNFGDKVRITNKYNPFAFHPATYHADSHIAINILGRVTLVTVDEAELELVERPHRRRGGKRWRRSKKAFSVAH